MSPDFNCVRSEWPCHRRIDRSHDQSCVPTLDRGQGWYFLVDSARHDIQDRGDRLPRDFVKGDILRGEFLALSRSKWRWLPVWKIHTPLQCLHTAAAGNGEKAPDVQVIG